jgi:hypothetical protein
VTRSDATLPVVDRLESALETADIPGPYHRWGARLLSHLRKPVQVVVTGLPGSGKTALVNMLAGRAVLGGQDGAAIAEIAHGPDARAVFEMEDGSVAVSAGLARDAAWPAGVRLTRQELPDPRLERQSLVEIGLPADPAQQAARLQEIVARADMILWCTERFDETEQRLWAGVPDGLKDHSLLVLTMADRQMMRGVLASRIEALDPIVAEEFLGLYPVATMQGLTALTAEAAVDDRLWASSGGKALAACVAHQVEQGRSSDVDQAQMLLDRLAARTGGRGARPRDMSAASGEVMALPSDLPKGGEALLGQAVSVLQARARAMLEATDGDAGVDTDRLLDDCVDAVSAISGLMEQAGDGAEHGPAAAELRADLQDGEEMLLLFQLERGEEAALDAVTLLLQLRKEMVGRIAVAEGAR